LVGTAAPMAIDSVNFAADPLDDRKNDGQISSAVARPSRARACSMDPLSSAWGAASLCSISTLDELMSSVSFFGRAKGSGKDAVIYVLDFSWHSWALRCPRRGNVKLPSAPRIDLEVAEQLRLISTIAPLCEEPRVSCSEIADNPVGRGKMLVVGGDVSTILDLPSDVQDFCRTYKLQAILVDTWEEVAEAIEAVVLEMTTASVEREKCQDEKCQDEECLSRTSSSLLSWTRRLGAKRSIWSTSSTGSVRSESTSSRFSGTNVLGPTPEFDTLAASGCPHNAHAAPALGGQLPVGAPLASRISPPASGWNLPVVASLRPLWGVVSGSFLEGRLSLSCPKGVFA